MKIKTLITCIFILLFCAGCGKGGKDAAKAPALITAAKAEARPVEQTEYTVGRVECKVSPFVSAEVAGRVTKVNVDVGSVVGAGGVLVEIDPENYALALQQAEAAFMRLEAMVKNQERLFERQGNLMKDNFVSETSYESTETQLAVCREELKAAEAQRGLARKNLAQTKVKAPVAGTIKSRAINEGDYLKLGDRLFNIYTDDVLQIFLPFPEALAGKIKSGLTVRLSTPALAGQPVISRLSEVRPKVNTGSRSLEALVELPNPGGWRPGSSVDATVVLEVRDNAVVVPELSVVKRSSGLVVYVVNGPSAEHKVEQRKVAVGARLPGFVEIISGLKAGETVAVDGAAFLTHGLAVRVKGEPGA